MQRLTLCARIMVAAALVTPAVGLYAPAASAQTPAPAHAAEAQARFNHGREYFLHDQFAPALTEFQASIALYRSPNSMLYVGLCLARMGRTSEAYNTLSEAAALALAPGESRYAATGARAQHEAAALEAQVARLTVHVEHPPADLAVRVEGDLLAPDGWNHPIARAPGTVTLSASASGYRVFNRTLNLTAGAVDDVTVALESESLADTLPPLPAATPTVAEPTTLPTEPGAATPPGDGTPPTEPAPAEPTPDAPRPGRGLRVAGWITGSVGLAGLVGAAAFGAMASSRYNAVQASCHDTHCASSYADQIDGGVGLQTAANVSLGAGLGLLGVGVTLLVLGFTRHADTPPAETPSPSVEAWLDPSHGTLGVRGAF